MTATQQAIIDGLIKEFNKIAPKPETNGKFTLKTIENCLNKKDEFYETLRLYNLAIAKELELVFNKQIKAIEKEFKKVFTIQIGNHMNNPTWYTFDGLIENIKKTLTVTECHIYFVSKTKVDRDSSSTNNMASYKINCYFKYSTKLLTLESGEKLTAKKIIGLTFSNYSEYKSHESYALKNDTLEGLLNENPTIQQYLIDLVKQ